MKIKSSLFLTFIIFLLLTSCNGIPSSTPATPLESTPVSSGETDSTMLPEVTNTPEPTPSEPMAATVNGEGIRLSDYEEEVQRYLLASEKLGKEIDQIQARTIVLDSMVDTILLAQGARQAGFSVDDQSYEEKLQSLISDVGGESQFQQWLVENNYSTESFERIYKLQIEATWMRDRIIGQVPTRAEQIRARQILVSSKTLAEDIYNQLQNGADFGFYAWGYDQLSGGELGWFPRGYLIVPQVEDAVFNLQTSEYTQVIESDYGFHIVQVMERELDRELTQDALLQKQRAALIDWLTNQKTNSTIIVNQE